VVLAVLEDLGGRGT